MASVECCSAGQPDAAATHAPVGRVETHDGIQMYITGPEANNASGMAIIVAPDIFGFGEQNGLCGEKKKKITKKNTNQTQPSAHLPPNSLSHTHTHTNTQSHTYHSQRPDYLRQAV
jgi:hypothetical protein